MKRNGKAGGSRFPLWPWVPCLTCVVCCALLGQDVLTQHNDAARTGAQLHETVLTPANVRPATFGKLYERSVNGQIISQPLYESALQIPGRGQRNVVFVATRENFIYAFDADDTSQNPLAGLIWNAPVQLNTSGRPKPNPFPMCGETKGPVGINSTPVIDRQTGTMYVTARDSDGGIWLHAIDVLTGGPKKRAVQVIVPGFDQTRELQRAALLVQDEQIYMAFSALNCDNAGWRGWVLAYHTSDLRLTGKFVTSRSDSSHGAGIWQSGNGLVGDGHGNIYFATGNDAQHSENDLGESFVKLHAGPAPKFGLTLVEPPYRVSNWDTLNGGDTDLGSGGPVLLPGNRLVGGGKQGRLYVLNTENMSAAQNPPGPGAPPIDGSDGFQAFFNTWHNNPGEVACSTPVLMTSSHCFIAQALYATGELFGPNIHGGPIYWDRANPAHGLLYAMPEKDFLRSYKFDHGTHTLDTVVSAVSKVRSPDGMPGSHLSLSANGAANGIIWASVPKMDGQWNIVPGMLMAFDALTLAELWRDDDNIAFAKFTPPTVAGGKVFRPTFAGKLIVYGLRNFPEINPVPCYGIDQKYQNYGATDGMLGDGTSQELPIAGGRFRHFQGGSIYWTSSTCAHEVQDQIRDKWAEIGWERSTLGFPTTDETVTPDGIGRFNHFQGGSIYWSPKTGAHEVHGAIRDEWARLGWERSALGYPISDETNQVNGNGTFNLFEHGTILWFRSSSSIAVSSLPAILLGPGKSGVNRVGSDISNFDLPEENPAMCQQQCAADGNCRSWTYVKRGVQGPKARCWIKGGIPIEQPDACCTSGIKVDVHPPNISPPAGNLNRLGSDFTSFNLVSPDFLLCQGECARNATCRSWTYVDETRDKIGNIIPGRCWLKNAVPPAIPPASPQDGCCVSGSK